MDKAHIKKLRTPATASKGVPDVRNLNVREAIRQLENAGLTVRFSGSGFVSAQSLAPGTSFIHGQTINLTLRHG